MQGQGEGVAGRLPGLREHGGALHAATRRYYVLPHVLGSHQIGAQGQIDHLLGVTEYRDPVLTPHVIGGKLAPNLVPIRLAETQVGLDGCHPGR